MVSKIVQIWYICSRQFHNGKKGAHEVLLNTEHSQKLQGDKLQLYFVIAHIAFEIFPLH